MCIAILKQSKFLRITKMVRLGWFAVGNSFQFGYQMDDVN